MKPDASLTKVFMAARSTRRLETSPD